MEHEVLTEVPPQLRRLVRLVARAFYQPEHIVVLDILSKYPCVTESDLVDVLNLQGSQKQLRQALTFLKKDKLIKSLQKMESEEGVEEKEKHLKMVHYYYINYKQFVNVVKYKLDQMRKKIEAEERKAKNHISYVCPRCGSAFSDLDVDRLFDPTEGNLRCSHCGSVLEEDTSDTERMDARTLISRLNDQMKPIMVLLRETENINLAPEVLEPEAQSIQKLLQSQGLKAGASGKHGQDQHTWATTRKATDIYGADQTIKVNIGTEEELRRQNQPVAKERPQWMKYSTVHPSGNLVQEEPTPAPGAAAEPSVIEPVVSKPGHQIMAELLAHEVKHPEFPGGMAGVGHMGLGGASMAEYSSSSSSEEEEGPELQAGTSWLQPSSSQLSESEEDEEEEEEQFTMKIGDRVVALNEVTSEMVAQMTEEERETYTRLCQQAMSDYY